MSSIRKSRKNIFSFKFNCYIFVQNMYWKVFYSCKLMFCLYKLSIILYLVNNFLVFISRAWCKTIATTLSCITSYNSFAPRSRYAISSFRAGMPAKLSWVITWAWRSQSPSIWTAALYNYLPWCINTYLATCFNTYHAS